MTADYSIGERISWIDVSGVEHQLDDIYDNPTQGNFLALTGRSGFSMEPFQEISQTVPLQPGARFRYSIANVRPVLLPLLVKGYSETGLINLLRQMRVWFDPTLGAGKLRNYTQDGTIRELNCYYDAGLEIDESDQHRRPGNLDTILSFHADDPFWYDQNATTQTFTAGAPVAFLTSPFLPLHLSSSGLLSSFAVNNAGDVLAWPVWTINGPMTSLVLTNTTTGLSLTITLTLLSTDVLVIDTRPGAKSVTLNGTTNEYGTMTAGSGLWPLVTDANNITAAMAAATSQSLITLEYKQGWHGV